MIECSFFYGVASFDFKEGADPESKELAVLTDQLSEKFRRAAVDLAKETGLSGDQHGEALSSAKARVQNHSSDLNSMIEHYVPYCREIRLANGID